MSTIDDPASRLAALSAGLIPIFRGRVCDRLLGGRAAVVFDEDQLLYDLGDAQPTLFFIRHGVVKVGTIRGDGSEIIYDIRKDGDVVGELCAIQAIRRDRAVAVSRTEAVPIAFDEAVQALTGHPELLRDFISLFCSALADAYAHMNRLAADDVMHRLIGVLAALAQKLGRPAGRFVELEAYLTQEEISQMVAARRERVSTALNVLRRQGLIQYSSRGQLLLDVRALEAYEPSRK